MADRYTFDGDVAESPYHGVPRNLRNILDGGSHSSLDASDSIYTVSHGAVEGPAKVCYENGAPLFHVVVTSPSQRKSGAAMMQWSALRAAPCGVWTRCWALYSRAPSSIGTW